MSADYDCYLLAPDADYVLEHFDSGYSADVSNTGRGRLSFGTLEYTEVVNNVGAFNITLPYPQFDISKARLDSRLVVWRRPAGGHRYLAFAGLVRSSPYPEIIQRGNEMYCVLRGQTYNHILKRRVIAAFAGTAGASKSGPADSVMKEFVDENLVSSLIPSRNLGAVFTIEDDAALGTAINKAASYDNLLKVLQDISNDSHTTESTCVYFGVVPTGSGWSMEFRTRIGQWGNDHRHPSGPSGVTGAQGPVVLSLDRQNLDNVSLIHDRMDEYNYVYGLGPNEGQERIINGAGAVMQSDDSPLNLIEVSVNASNAASGGEVTAVAFAKLWDGLPRRQFSASIVDTPGTIYGLHYGLGDYVTASIAKLVFDCRIEAVTVQVGDRDEKITAQIKAEGWEW